MNAPLSCGFEMAPHGVRLGFASELPEALEALRERVVLPGWQTAPLRGEPTFWVERERSVYRALGADGTITAEQELDKVASAVAALAHHQVASLAEDALFVHAGVVSWKGQGLLLPGFSFAGKSTLTASLVRAGATYYSDEYAVVETATGLVRAFPRPLSLCDGWTSLAELGWRGQPPPLRIAAVFAVRHDPALGWNGKSLTAGESVLALFAHTVAAQRLGSEAMVALQRALAEARGWEGTRGEAEETAERIKRWLEP